MLKTLLETLFPARVMHVRDLIPIYQVAIAFCCAYMALDYFKWTHRLEAVKNEHFDGFKRFTEPLKDAQAGLYERYAKLIKLIMEHYSNFLTPHNDLRHRYEEHKPWIKDLMIILTILNLGLLVICSLYIWNVHTPYGYLWALPALLGIIGSSIGAYHVHTIATRFRETLFLTTNTYESLAQQDDSLGVQIATIKCLLLDTLANMLNAHGTERQRQRDFLKTQIDKHKKIEDINAFIEKHALLKNYNKLP